MFNLCRAVWLQARYQRYLSRRPTKVTKKLWYWERGGNAAEHTFFIAEWR